MYRQAVRQTERKAKRWTGKQADRQISREKMKARQMIRRQSQGSWKSLTISYKKSVFSVFKYYRDMKQIFCIA